MSGPALILICSKLGIAAEVRHVPVRNGDWQIEGVARQVAARETLLLSRESWVMLKVLLLATRCPPALTEMLDGPSLL